MREFPESAERRPDDLTRREFVRLFAATAALAGIGGCTMRPPDDPILPYVTPSEAAPGVPRHYATAMTLDGDATGLVIESHDGRPTKVEGNPLHPASLGAAGIFQQASLLQLYDPQRASGVRYRGAPSSWESFAAAFAPPALSRLAGTDGAGLRLLLEPTSSPLVAEMLARLQTRYPAMRTAYYSPVSRHPLYLGTQLAFGRTLQPLLQLDRATVIVALDADFLSQGPFTLHYARRWADARRLRGEPPTMSRLYVAESMLTPTGSSADARVAVRPSDLLLVADALAMAIETGLAADALPPQTRAWIASAAADLRRAGPQGVVVAGERQSPLVHALAAAVNARLGSAGQSIAYLPPTWLDAGAPSHELGVLLDEIRAGAVSVLLVLGPNPVYAAPEAMDVAGTLALVPHLACFGPFLNETVRRAEWALAESHYTESWGDGRAYDGTVSIVQPLIAPLYGGRTIAEVLAMLDGDARPDAYRLTREFWTASRPDADEWWTMALREGVVPDSALSPVAVDSPRSLEGLRQQVAAAMPVRSGLELIAPVSTVYDGRFANNPWLQELPHPMSKLTWGNAAYVNAATANRLDLATGDMVELRANDRSAQAPAFVLPGIADDTVVLPFGYGRFGDEPIAAGVGVRASRLLVPDAASVGGVTARRLMSLTRNGTEPLRKELPIAQAHGDMHDRPIALAATLDHYRQQPDVAGQRDLPTLYRPFPLAERPQWGMAIDLTVCTGCSACVVACQAENNIPSVGADGVLAHREMSWLRIDRYFTPQEGAPTEVVMQPMLCQHCEMAPCEYVCPVEATTHSADGLNEMIYNRCVGTRFCSNNCPYKVRRFNWFDYNAAVPEVREMGMNPDVTVRERGVMEKCTFCVQRIREAQIRARLDARDLAPDDVVTACQQACPTRAIVFGPIDNREADVTPLYYSRRAYAVLHELGTRPRVHYLPKITNPPARGSAP